MIKVHKGPLDVSGRYNYIEKRLPHAQFLQSVPHRYFERAKPLKAKATYRSQQMLAQKVQSLKRWLRSGVRNRDPKSNRLLVSFLPPFAISFLLIEEREHLLP